MDYCCKGRYLFLNKLLNLSLSMLDSSIEAVPLRSKTDSLHTRYCCKHRTSKVTATSQLTMILPLPGAGYKLGGLSSVLPEVPLFQNLIDLCLTAIVDEVCTEEFRERAGNGVGGAVDRDAAIYIGSGAAAGMDTESEHLRVMDFK